MKIYTSLYTNTNSQVDRYQWNLGQENLIILKWPNSYIEMCILPSIVLEPHSFQNTSDKRKPISKHKRMDYKTLDYFLNIFYTLVLIWLNRVRHRVQIFLYKYLIRKTDFTFFSMYIFICYNKLNFSRATNLISLPFEVMLFRESTYCVLNTCSQFLTKSV